MGGVAALARELGLQQALGRTRGQAQRTDGDAQGAGQQQLVA